jgi:hypothetical protein
VTLKDEEGQFESQTNGGAQAFVLSPDKRGNRKSEVLVRQMSGNATYQELLPETQLLRRQFYCTFESASS